MGELYLIVEYWISCQNVADFEQPKSFPNASTWNKWAVNNFLLQGKLATIVWYVPTCKSLSWRTAALSKN